MGLGITAYSRLDYIGHHPGPKTPDGNEGENCQYDEETYDRLHLQAFAYSDFPHALQGIPGTPDIRGEAFGWDSLISAGCFALTAGTETHSFEAGSYGGYDQWREHLGRCFGWSRDTEDPFFELIYFADNEGTLLWLPAKNLLADFEAGREKWRDYCVDIFSDQPYQPKYYLEKYENWAHACELAADGGLVDFH